MTEADVRYAQMKGLQHSCSKSFRVKSNPIMCEDAAPPSRNLARSIMYSSKYYTFLCPDSTPEATGERATGSYAEVHVFFASNAEYREKSVTYILMCVFSAGPALGQ